MGEEFLAWAEEYFSADDKRNTRLPRKEIYDAFLEYSSSPRKYNTPNAFRVKIESYCKWKGYTLNPQKYDPVTGIPFQTDKDGQPVIDDKSGGVEYFTIGDNTFASTGAGDLDILTQPLTPTF
jgi:hypothetical protein